MAWQGSLTVKYRDTLGAVQSVTTGSYSTREATQAAALEVAVKGFWATFVDDPSSFNGKFIPPVKVEEVVASVVFV